MTPTVAGWGVALPGAITQDALWEGFFHHHFLPREVARRIFAASGVRRRHAVANPLAEDLSRWSTSRRMRRFAEEAHPLGHRAVTLAMTDAGTGADEIGLLAVASCTGYGTPGLDIRLAASLDLPPDTQRVLIGHMGCYAALPALRSVADYVATHRRPAVLLCVELTSLHLQGPTTDRQQMVSHALFGDAATALVVRPATPARPTTGRELELLDVAAHTDVTASDHMTWEITDLGFRMGLSPRVPDLLAKHLRPTVERLLAGHGLDVPDVRAWAVHPGGPRILSLVEDELSLPPHALSASRSVLAERGNCSSTTVLLVLDEVLRTRRLGQGDTAVALAFGPGLSLYAALLRSPGPHQDRARQ
ncbi:type III polyketide synthase [Streptoalloteichus tenebrarius]|uniref:type III polyketide synthase n=1 Tax=Streptoalloteichus tenebrarius (strain ATCC 17920 / DSM 40477 / JCM 4838 / CBS 697.72 / NBRC 16177 / NCIMB 11028 / NRRL B-12390 / A12253. 1 / ISP 5477) TaxID=1933 RepID=UPI0027E29FDD|nr:type III polyketide synthase [Streptoalloteichus tenebrarius]